MGGVKSELWFRLSQATVWEHVLSVWNVSHTKSLEHMWQLNMKTCAYILPEMQINCHDATSKRISNHHDALLCSTNPVRSTIPFFALLLMRKCPILRKLPASTLHPPSFTSLQQRLLPLGGCWLVPVILCPSWKRGRFLNMDLREIKLEISAIQLPRKVVDTDLITTYYFEVSDLYWRPVVIKRSNGLILQWKALTNNQSPF